MNPNTPRFLKPSLVLVGLLLACPAWAQLSLTILHSFSGARDGKQPYAGLAEGSDGALYGTTFEGGANKAGVVFKVNPDGSDSVPLYSFDSNSISPGGLANPSGLIEGADGALYGTSGLGGSSGYGTVFRINRDGTGYRALHSFDAAFGGPYAPSASLVQGRDGSLYGTTQSGGVLGGGCVFRVSTNGTAFTVLHHFGYAADGQSPQSPLTQGSDGALYGTTTLGGTGVADGGSGFGTIFKIIPDATSYTVLHSFGATGDNGQYPYTAGLLEGQDGALYGTTQQGGSTSNGSGTGFGTVFKIQRDGSGFAVLHNFNEAPGGGKYPNSTLVQGKDGTLYGITEQGGAHNLGVIFRLNNDGSQYEVLYHFGAGPNDGKYPRAPLVQASDGGLFGTTQFGGANDLGTVFRLGPAAPRISSVIPLSDKSVRLTVTAAPNFVYRIEGSADHRHWFPLTNIMNSKGTMEFIDSGAANAPRRFYRAAWVP